MMEHSPNNIIKIRLFTALISLLLSTFAFYSDDIINRDGILYMDMAAAFLQGGLTETARLYDWPFFSIIVAYLHKLTGLPLEISAGVLNSLFFVLLTDTLILICNKILPNSRQLVIAAVFILCFQVINDYRDFIIRDIGYWALCSLTLYRFILFLEAPSIKNATIWQLVAVISILFRIEGIVILLGLPLYLFATQHPKLAIKHSLQLSYLLIIAAFITSIVIASQSGLTNGFGKLSTVSSYINPNNFVAPLNSKTLVLANQVLNKYSKEYGGLILISGLLIMLLYKLIKALSFGYIFLYVASWWQSRNNQAFPYQWLLTYFTAINLLILIVFLFKQYFMVTRYSVITLIGLLLLLLPKICHFLEHAWLSKNRIYISITGLILLICLVDSFTQSNSKFFIKNTALWASQNLPANSTVLTDDEFIHYYFNTLTPMAVLSKKKNLKHYQKYDYLTVVVKRRNTTLKNSLKNMNIEPFYCQENKRGDQACVYKISP